MSILIKGAAIMGREIADILIDGDSIAEVGNISVDADTVIDATGLIALPGLVDLHTHLREPGRRRRNDSYRFARGSCGWFHRRPRDGQHESGG